MFTLGTAENDRVVRPITPGIGVTPGNPWFFGTRNDSNTSGGPQSTLVSGLLRLNGRVHPPLGSLWEQALSNELRLARSPAAALDDTRRVGGDSRIGRYIVGDDCAGPDY